MLLLVIQGLFKKANAIINNMPINTNIQKIPFQSVTSNKTPPNTGAQTGAMPCTELSIEKASKLSPFVEIRGDGFGNNYSTGSGQSL